MRIAIGGSAANPPTTGHKKLLEAVLYCGRFDRVIWILSGNHGEKHLNEVSPNHRIAMTELLVRDLRLRVNPDLYIIYDDVYRENTSTIEWLDKLQEQYPNDELVWFTGTDSVVPLPDKDKCEIELKWHRGQELMAKWPFLLLTRVGYGLGADFKRASFPKGFRYDILDVKLPDTASSLVRRYISNGVPIEQIGVPGQPALDDAVINYIKLHGLYGWKEGI